jgi:hypothetical protein
MREDQPGVKVGKIKKALTHNKEILKDSHENNYSIYDSHLDSFTKDFFNTLPESKKSVNKNHEIIFGNYIENTLQKKGDLTAIEFGGPGTNLFWDLVPIFKRTISVCLNDIRPEKEKKIDNAINHSVIEGDIMDVRSGKLLNNIKEKLGTNKTDLIISRMAGPLNYINKNGAILDRLIRNWYNLLNENGLMFIQFNFKENLHIPNTDLQILIEKWAIAIKKLFPEIDIQVEKNALRLHKRKGAPEDLPNTYQLFQS